MRGVAANDPYRGTCAKIAKDVLKSDGKIRHVIYGIGDDFTDWPNEMIRFYDDDEFSEYCHGLVYETGVVIYAVHARELTRSGICANV